MSVFAVRLVVLRYRIHVAGHRRKMSTNFNIKERFINANRIDCDDAVTQHRNLVAFDFDHTVVNDNTDIVVRDLIAKEKISDDVKLLYTSSGWIPYMQAIFKLLHSNGFKRNDLLTAIECIPEVNGMKELMRRLHETQQTDVIVVSDSNSEFIGHWCRHNGINEYVTQVFTNPAAFNTDDLLNIQPHHHQTTCTLSSVNLCKGDVLANYLQEQQKTNDLMYKKIFYVGDGHNDLCPILRLAKDDYGCARNGYRLEKELQALDTPENDKSNGHTIDAGVFVWNDGNELAEFILKNI